MTQQKIRILIVDDHAVVRRGLAMVLRLDPDFEVVGEAGNGRQAIEMARALSPDLVLLDIVMPEMDGEATALALKKEMPQVKILVLSGTAVDEGVVSMLAAGVDGYVLKEIEPRELKRAIRSVIRGEAYLHPAVARQVIKKMNAAPRATQTQLTARELEVLRWMATPATYREIADRLMISEETVRSHAKRILNKLNQPNRTQAILAALRDGLIELSDQEN